MISPSGVNPPLSAIYRLTTPECDQPGRCRSELTPACGGGHVPQRASLLEAVFAAAMVGADVVLLNTDFRTESLAAALSTHRIGMVICDNEFEARAHDADDSVTVIDAANAFAHDGGPRPKVAAAGRIVLLTSGTTGAPEGVPRHPEIRLALGIGASILDRTGLRIGSRISLPVPLFHGLGFGMLVLTLGLGGTVLTGRRFDAERMLAQASEHRAEALTVVPVMLARILDLAEDGGRETRCRRYEW